LKNQKYYYQVKARKGDEEIVSAVDSFIVKEEQPKDEKPPFVVTNWIFPYERDALLLFTVNEPSIGELVYGTERGVWTDTVRVERYKYSHVYVLENLEPNTVYYYELKLTDLAGNTGYFPMRNALARTSGISDDGSFFSTGGEKDDAAPEFVTGPEFFLNSQGTVGLYWETDEPVLMEVEIWRGDDLLSRYEDWENFQLSRNFQASGLESGDGYQFLIRVFDLSGNENTWLSVVTEVGEEEILPPVITLTPNHEIGNGILQVRWETDIPSSSEIRWGYSQEELTEQFRRTEMVREHEMFMNQGDLTRTIYYQVRSGVDTAYCAWSEINSFTPAVSIDETEEEFAENSLFQISAYPNPFSDEIKIKIRLKETGRIKLDIYNTLGARVKKLLNRECPGGTQEIVWNGKDEHGNLLSSGVYLLNMNYRKNNVKEEKRQVLKILLVR